MKPLVLIDADVLGRERTGDETYVENLLRELPGAASDLRFAAATRNPALVPDGVEAIELAARSQELRMAIGVPRLLRHLRPALAHFQHALPLRNTCPAIVTIHDLSFEREPSLIVVSACSGHGFKFAPVIGEIVALRVQGMAPPLDLALFDATRLAPR